MWLRIKNKLINLNRAQDIYISKYDGAWKVSVCFGGEDYYGISEFKTEQEAQEKLKEIEQIMKIHALCKVVEV